MTKGTTRQGVPEVEAQMPEATEEIDRAIIRCDETIKALNHFEIEVLAYIQRRRNEALQMRRLAIEKLEAYVAAKHTGGV